LLLNFGFKPELFPLHFSREILNLKCVVYKKNELDAKRLWLWCGAFIFHWNAHGWILASHGFIKSHVAGIFISFAWTSYRTFNSIFSHWASFHWHAHGWILASHIIVTHITMLFTRLAWTESRAVLLSMVYM